MNKLLWSFAPIKSSLESPVCLFLSRDAKVKSEEAALVGLGTDSVLCSATDLLH